MKSFTIARRLPLALVISALLVGAGVGTASYLIGAGALQAQARQSLATLAFERSNQLSLYMQSVVADLRATAGADATIQALRDFAGAWLQIKDTDPATALKQVYVAGNPNPPDKRLLLDTPET